MATPFDFITGALLLMVGVYAALAGAIAAVVGIPDCAPSRLVRPAAALVAVVGLACYLAGAAIVAGLFRGLP